MGIRQKKLSNADKNPFETIREDERGQMTVEFVAVFPVLLIIAVIATNALLFFSECASFDICAKEAIRVYATSPSYGQTTEQSLSRIEALLDETCTKEYLSSTVAVSGENSGFTTYTATLYFSPTLFGLGLRSDIFGVSLPQLSHSTSLSIDVYKPGVIR